MAEVLTGTGECRVGAGRNWSPPTAPRPPRTDTAATCRRETLALAVRVDGASPASWTPSSSTCSARASWRCTRPAAGRRPRRSARRRCLRKTDWLFPQYRELGAFLVRGIAPAQMGAVWRGAWHGGLGFTAKCCAPIAIPIGTHTLHAVGAAMAAQRLGEDSVTVAFLGDGATSEGDAHEALNLAAVFDAPCVFFVQNNQWAISVPVQRQQAAARRSRTGRSGTACRASGSTATMCWRATR